MKSGKLTTFNRRALNAALASALVLGGTGMVGGAYAADGIGTSTATVVTPIAISASTVDLAFGSFTTDAVNQTVTITASNDARSNSGTVLLASTASAASFNVTGTGTQTYTISLPTTSEISIGGSGTGTSAMTVSSFTSFPATTGALTGGAQTLKVGGTITTKASQVAGAYTGTFTVTVAYN